MNPTNDDYRHFVTIVAGDEPDKLIAKYSFENRTEPYLVYRHKDAEALRQKFIESYTFLTENESNLPESVVFSMKESLKELKEMDSEEFYEGLTEGLIIEEETFDAYNDANPDGKYTTCAVGKAFSMPFLLKDGREVFQARKAEIAWENIHMADGGAYVRVWEMVMDGSEPRSEYEQVLYENMKDKVPYFKKFGNMATYVASNTAFWGYAFLSEETGWVDVSKNPDQFKWMTEYYDTFIKNLPDDTMLTIYECVR